MRERWRDYAPRRGSKSRCALLRCCRCDVGREGQCARRLLTARAPRNAPRQARGVDTEQLFPLLIRAATQSDEGGPAGHQGECARPRLSLHCELTRRVQPRRAALLDYFDFVSRVNAVVVTARALADVLLDPELHKFAAHLLALLHVRTAAACRIATQRPDAARRAQQCIGGIREVRTDVKPIRRRVQEQVRPAAAVCDAGVV